MSIKERTEKIEIIRQVLDILLSLLYPNRCPGCDEVLELKRYKIGFCKKCSPKVTRNTGATCFVCGREIASETEEYCSSCKKKSRAFVQAKAVYRYEGVMKDSVYRFKYANRRYYGKQYAKDCVKIHGKWLKMQDFDVLIPVPMYWAKKRKRGYNQAETFARYLSRETGIPVRTDLVARVKNTEPMKYIGDHGRQQNLENAFKVRQEVVKFKKVLIIDDIYTTGSTMNAIAKSLRAVGVNGVYCMSVCTGKGD